MGDRMTSLMWIGSALTILGDAWTLLILRSAFHGTRRFSDWQGELGVPKAVLSNRLDRLVEAEAGRDPDALRFEPEGAEVRAEPERGGS